MVTAAQAMPPEQEGKSVDKNVEAANKLFPCPKAKWDVVKQPFWRHRTILKLRSCQWPHRPTVATDGQGVAHLITDGVLRISEESTLNQFNAMAKSESVEINADNAPDYLRFFINAHLNWRDGLYFGDRALEQEVRTLWQQPDAEVRSEKTDHQTAELGTPGTIPVTEVNEHGDFEATVFEWSPDWAKNTTNPPGIERFDVTIHQDGTIALTSRWIWRTTP
jgi:hypothetical protein